MASVCPVTFLAIDEFETPSRRFGSGFNCGAYT